MLILKDLRTLDLDTVVTALSSVVTRCGSDVTFASRKHALTGNGEDTGIGCSYTLPTPNGTPVAACIVGVMLVDEFGVNPNDFTTCTTDFGSLINGQSVETALNVLEVPNYDAISQEALDFLRTAQSAQDNNETWGEALRKARVQANLDGVTDTPVEDAGFAETTDLIGSEEFNRCMSIARSSAIILGHIDNKAKIAGIKHIRDQYRYRFNQTVSLRASKDAYEAVERERENPFNEPPF